MSLMVLWSVIFLLVVAVLFLLWLQFKNQSEHLYDLQKVQQLETQVQNLEENLKKTLEIMQDLAKKMHVQQEAMDKTVQKMQQMDGQNVELIQMMSRVLNKD